VRRTLYLLLLLPGLASAQASGDASSKALERLSNELRARPNRPQTHLEVARAYFRRGAQDDAGRVRRHLGRATELNPSLDDDATRLLQEEEPGDRESARTRREREVDERIRAAVPVIRDGAGSAASWDEVIQMGLAERMVDRSPPEDLTSYEEAKEEFAAVFDMEDGTSPHLRKRLAMAAQSQGGGGSQWQQAWTRQVARNVVGRRQPGAELEPVEIDGEEVPDPFVVKTLAVQAFFEGDSETALASLVDTVAAAEVLRNDQLRGATGALVEGVDAAGEAASPERFDEAGPPSDIGGNARVGPGGPGAPGAGGGNAPPGGPGGPGGVGGDPGAEAPPNTPPELAQSIGEQALQTLEAASNEEVPASEVQAEMAQLAAEGAVGEPLLLDLDRDGAPAVPGGSIWPDGVLSPERVLFDLDADGHAEWTEWPAPGRDALLAVDLDGDGVIRDGDELFGWTGGAANGFERLARFDVDGDGWVAGAEAADLVAWRDDGDGVSRWSP
jgi:hypothetical protein